MLDNIVDLDKVFKYLRKRAKEEYSCGNRDFIAEFFHEADCPYIPISEKAFAEYYAGTFVPELEPKKEIRHAVIISKESTSEVEEPARGPETGLAADDFKLTTG